jgi:hypothetical protein
MPGNSENRRRVFADVVTVDAWHMDFSNEHGKADLHADVVFDTARIGAETESKIRFRLSLKRAEVVVIIPETEPVTVDKGSISRDTPHHQVTKTSTLEQTAQASGKASASASISATSVTGSLDRVVLLEAQFPPIKRLNRLKMLA